jgi:hypothetical protein
VKTQDRFAQKLECFTQNKIITTEPQKRTCATATATATEAAAGACATAYERTQRRWYKRSDK